MAHDLRRSFGERWPGRVMPQVLRELMRHENIETTMKYYVGRNAERTADALWAAYDQQQPKQAPAQKRELPDVGGVLGGTDQERPQSEETEAADVTPQTL